MYHYKLWQMTDSALLTLMGVNVQSAFYHMGLLIVIRTNLVCNFILVTLPLVKWPSI